MTVQAPVVTQRIFGAFNPATNLLVGIQISGETPYQNVPNELITPVYAGVRTATAAATNSVMTLGKSTQGDGSGGIYVFNPGDTVSGCVCFGTVAGTVLTVSSVSSGTISVGLTLATAATGVPIATIASFGTGGGGTGTYNLSTPATIVPLTQFVLDNNSTILVSGDGSRWYLNTTTATGPFTFNAPSGNPAIRLTTPSYTLGNATDNPNIVMLGTGAFTVPILNTPIATVGPPTVGTALTVNGLSGAAQTTVFTGGAATDINCSFNAVTGNTVSLWLNSNGLTNGNSAVLQMNTATNLRLKNLTAGGSLDLGTGGGGVTEQIQITSAGVILGFGPVANSYVNMNPDASSWTTTLGGQVTGSPTGTVKWERQGTQVTVWTDSAIVGTTSVGGTGGISMSALPAAITPTTARTTTMLGQINATQALLFVAISAGGSLNLTAGFTAAFTGATGVIPSNFPTSTANCGTIAGSSFTYSL